jgi:hypothetical protein
VQGQVKPRGCLLLQAIADQVQGESHHIFVTTEVIGIDLYFIALVL